MGLSWRRIKALGFDQYGTIVDMQKGLTEAVTPFLQAKGWDGEPHRFVRWDRHDRPEDSRPEPTTPRPLLTRSLIFHPFAFHP